MSQTFFEEYENSILIPDQSAWQQVCFWYTKCNLRNIGQFLNENGIQIITTSDSANELTKSIYNPNLFNCDWENTITSSQVVPKRLTISAIDFVPTTHPVGDLSIQIWQIFLEEEHSYQPPLWNFAPSFQRMLKRSRADISNILLARYLQKEKKKFFIFVNDNDQISQCKLEGFRYMRPLTMLRWMLKCKYLTKRRFELICEEMKKHNSQWLPKNIEKLY
jgi:hypothetical protein